LKMKTGERHYLVIFKIPLCQKPHQLRAPDGAFSLMHLSIEPYNLVEVQIKPSPLAPPPCLGEFPRKKYIVPIMAGPMAGYTIHASLRSYRALQLIDFSLKTTKMLFACFTFIHKTGMGLYGGHSIAPKTTSANAASASP